MKSYCIKTDDERIIEYLLNKISKLEFPNIYYCKKSFKIYENVVMHYKEHELDRFKNIVATLIVDTIRHFFEERILKRIINVNYFYFDEFERNIIYEDCKEFLKQDEVEIKETIFVEVKKYIEENRNIVLEGVVNFRISEYVKLLDNTVDMAVNKYIIEKEYKEFINLLKIYVNTTPTKVDLLHLIYVGGESILLDEDKNIVQIDANISNTKYLSDISFSSNDIALNTLLSLLPRVLRIHVIDREDEFINTLKLIFDNRVEICRDCSICKTFSMRKESPMLSSKRN